MWTIFQLQGYHKVPLSGPLTPRSYPTWGVNTEGILFFLNRVSHYVALPGVELTHRSAYPHLFSIPYWHATPQLPVSSFTNYYFQFNCNVKFDQTEPSSCGF